MVWQLVPLCFHPLSRIFIWAVEAPLDDCMLVQNYRLKLTVLLPGALPTNPCTDPRSILDKKQTAVAHILPKPYTDPNASVPLDPDHNPVSK